MSRERGEKEEMTLKKLLKEKDLYSAQLARRVGKSRHTVAFWVKRASTPKLKDIHAIANALYVSELEVINCFIEPEEIEVKFVNHDIESFSALLAENLITEADLAKKLGQSRQSINYWATGKTLPQVKDLNRIAKAIGTDVLTVYNSFKERWTSRAE